MSTFETQAIFIHATIVVTLALWVLGERWKGAYVLLGLVLLALWGLTYPLAWFIVPFGVTRAFLFYLIAWLLLLTALRALARFLIRRTGQRRWLLLPATFGAAGLLLVIFGPEVVALATGREAWLADPGADAGRPGESDPIRRPGRGGARRRMGDSDHWR